MSNSQTTMQLSKRELQVLEMVVTGASNQEIAQKLVISVNTVKVHLRNIFEKLGVQSRTEATLRAIQDGLVTVGNEPQTVGEPVATGPGSNTYLVASSQPSFLPRWQQLYLFVALSVAIAFAAIPLIPKEKQRPIPDLPVIYLQPTPPAPPAHPNGNSTRWATHRPMPTSRAGLALVVYEGKIFAIGGVRTNNQATRSVEIYDPESDSWKEGANTLVAAANIAGAVINDKIYVPGGCTNDGQAVKTLEVYLPKTDTWSEGPPLPAARCGYGLAVFKSELYLFGGWNGTAFVDTIFVFSPETNRWKVLDIKLPVPVGYVGAAALGDAIYIVGGYDGHDEFNQTYAFFPESGDMIEKSPLAERRGGLGLISSSNKLFAVGGGWTRALQTSEKYDPTTDTWTSFEAPFSSQWRNMGLTVIDTKIYAVGGWDDTQEKFVNSVVSYQYIYQLFLPISRFGN